MAAIVPDDLASPATGAAQRSNISPTLGQSGVANSTSGATGAPGGRPNLFNSRHRQFHFTNLSGSDTFDFDGASGGQPVTILMVAWEPDTSADDGRASFAGMTITVTSSVNADGILHVWASA